MAQGYSLHIGLNFVDPNHYGGWDGKLNACEYDANDMQQIADNTGFKTTVLLRENAIRDNVINLIKQKAKNMTSEDIFLLTYSGHGSQKPDINSDEDDRTDETWCLFDGQLIDDELAKLWTLFPEGSRILLLSDSCHSGTIARPLANKFSGYKSLRVKSMPSKVCEDTYLANKEFYDKIIKRSKGEKIITCSVKLISGCQEDQYSYDGEENGVFTGTLKKVWNKGDFKGDYSVFYSKIREKLRGTNQDPNYYPVGRENKIFDKQKPFTI